MSVDWTESDIKKAFRQRGGPAMNNVRKMLATKKDSSSVSQALKYLSEVTLEKALPVFPALVSMANEAAGGKNENTLPFSEALLMISFAADLHDDIIDQSSKKGAKQTVLGKFNTPTAILTGDVLLVEGLKQLAEAAESDSMASKDLLSWVSEAVFEICRAESLQLQLKNKQDLKPEEYYEVIRLKSVVPELCMKIGASLGTNDSEVIKGIGQYGRIYGINSTLIEEFVDLLTKEELLNRLMNECPPLPMIYAMQNQDLKTAINHLTASEWNKDVHKKIVDTVLESSEADALLKILRSNALSAQKQLPESVKGKIRGELENLLFVPLNCFEA